MKRIGDALELLTAQHDEIEALMTRVHDDDRVHVLGEIADKLATHMSAEHELLYHLEIDEVGGDHERVQAAIASVFETPVDAPEMRERLDTFHELFSRHVRWQEDIVFVTLAETISPDVLETLGEVLAEWSENSLVVAA